MGLSFSTGAANGGKGGGKEVPDGSLTRFHEQVPKEPLLAARGGDDRDRHAAWGATRPGLASPPVSRIREALLSGGPGLARRQASNTAWLRAWGGGEGGEEGPPGVEPGAARFPGHPAPARGPGLHPGAGKGGTVGPGTWMSKSLSARGGGGGV